MHSVRDAEASKIGYQGPGALQILPFPKVRLCPARKKCSLVRGQTEEFPAAICPFRLPKGACSWVCKREGYLSVALIAGLGEISVKRIAVWFGVKGDVGKLGRITVKLKALVDHGILTSRRGPSKQGEKLYRIPGKADPLVLECMRRYELERDAKRDEKQALEAHAMRLAQEYEKMKKISFHGYDAGER